MISHIQITCNVIFTQTSVNIVIKKHEEVVISAMIKEFVPLNKVVVPGDHVVITYDAITLT